METLFSLKVIESVQIICLWNGLQWNASH